MCLFSFYPQSEKVADPLRLFSLLSLGEIGRHMYVENCSLCSLQYKRFWASSKALVFEFRLTAPLPAQPPITSSVTACEKGESY